MRANAITAAALGALLLASAPGPARAQNYLIYGAEQYFTVDWQVGQGRKGPVVSGFVHNRYGSPAGNVRLVVEMLDASGRVTDTRVYPMAGVFPNDARTYFELRVPPAPAYRVRVASWDWLRGGGS